MGPISTVIQNLEFHLKNFTVCKINKLPNHSKILMLADAYIDEFFYKFMDDWSLLSNEVLTFDKSEIADFFFEFQNKILILDHCA